nr:MAG TPA: hypothetical protein [Caudoviricetes sp.]
MMGAPMAYQVRTVPLETRNRAAIPDRPKRSSLSPICHSMLHATCHFISLPKD